MPDEPLAPKDPSPAPCERRTFFRRAAATVASAGMAGGALAAFLGWRDSPEPATGVRDLLGVIRPPGAVLEPEFMAKCIRCTRCADSCEAQCIRFFPPEAGRLQGTPYVVPIERGCTLCLECGKTCPSGAILPLENKEDADMGLAVVDERLCVSHNGTGVCGACFTVCPLRGKAITQGSHFAPTIHEDDCTGCGLCEEYCIVDERPGLRAIMVEGRKAAED